MLNIDQSHLVLLMQAESTFLETRMVGTRNNINEAIKNMMDFGRPFILIKIHPIQPVAELANGLSLKQYDLPI